MRKRNCYRVFAPTGVRLILYAALPALLLALQAFVLLRTGQSVLEVCAGLYAAASVYFDFWIFGGICARGTMAFEYLKTSAKGGRLIQTALIWDSSCHFCCMAAIVLPAAAFERMVLQTAGMTGAGWTVRLLTVLFLDYAVWLLAVSAARYVTMMVWYYVISVCAMGIFMALAAGALGQIAAGHIWVLVPAAAAALLLSVFSVKHVMRRMEGSYRDETIKTGNEDD